MMNDFEHVTKTKIIMVQLSLPKGLTGIDDFVRLLDTRNLLVPRGLTNFVVPRDILDKTMLLLPRGLTNFLVPRDILDKTMLFLPRGSNDYIIQGQKSGCKTSLYQKPSTKRIIYF
eukprot:TRINITY_DN10527_c0_g4_i1.p2 TRINITY_DN10527_c0_g4~~TRINITY_DN10527_c0_g4_i1.p2  ORF type:complete len:116 (-),score=8.28 TRINITY_DN10527_c0_g4_i1:335-682(-)